MASFRTVRQAAGKLGERLSQVMTKHPIAANSLVCFNLWVAGDLLAQHYEHQKKQHNQNKRDENDNNNSNNAPAAATIQWKRTAQAASYGAVVSGPLYAMWYPWLDRQLTTTWNVAARWAWSPARAAWAIPALKVAADEFLMDPPTIALFFTYMEYCQPSHGDDDDEEDGDHAAVDMASLFHKIREELPVAWLTSLCTWPFVLMATFRCVPLVWQPAVVNACAITWDGFLSHRNALAKEKKRQQRKQQQYQEQEQQYTDSRRRTAQRHGTTNGTKITVRRATTTTTTTSRHTEET